MGIESLTVVGASDNEKKFGHKALRKALEEGIEVYAVGRNKKSVSVTLNNGKRREVPVFNEVRDVLNVTEYIALYVPRKTILEEKLLNQIAEKRFPNVIIPPEENVGDLGLEIGGMIREELHKLGYSDDHILIDACYLRGI